MGDFATVFLGVLLFALVVVILVSLRKSLAIIPQAETRVIERLGKYNRTLNSGINFIIPVIEKARLIQWRYIATDVDSTVARIYTRTTDRIDLRETVYDFPSQHVITKDNVAIEIDALLYFSVMDPVRVVYEIVNLPDAIEKLTQTTLRNIIGELDLDQTLVSRDTINNRLRAILDEATAKWGIKVNRVELQDIIPPNDIREAMEKQMRAERDRRAAILTAEGDKTSAILEAEGSKNAAILKAEGEAEARRIVAIAEAEAINRVSEAIQKTTSDPASYMIAIRYIDALKEMVSGKDNKVVYLPYEASAVLSSLGGIRDLLAGGMDKR